MFGERCVPMAIQSSSSDARLYWYARSAICHRKDFDETDPNNHPNSYDNRSSAAGDGKELNTCTSKELIPLSKPSGSPYPWSKLQMNPKRSYRFGAYVEIQVEKALQYLLDLRAADPQAYRRWYERYLIYKTYPGWVPFPNPPPIRRNPTTEKVLMMKYLEQFYKRDKAGYARWYKMYKAHIDNPDQFRFPLVPGYHCDCPAIEYYKTEEETKPRSLSLPQPKSDLLPETHHKKFSVKNKQSFEQETPVVSTFQETPNQFLTNSNFNTPFSNSNQVENEFAVLEVTSQEFQTKREFDNEDCNI